MGKERKRSVRGVHHVSTAHAKMSDEAVLNDYQSSDQTLPEQLGATGPLFGVSVQL